MSLLSRPKISSNGCYQDITPKSANWDFVGFKAYELEPEQTLNLIEIDNELCLIILSGKADIKVEDDTFSNIGDRMSVFEDLKPHALYVPNNNQVTIKATTKLELQLQWHLVLVTIL